jgi:hypothetical protein
LANWFWATVTVIGSAGSLRSFLVNSLINNPSLAYPLLYDALLQQIFDARSLFPGYTFQLVNQSIIKLD